MARAVQISIGLLAIILLGGFTPSALARVAGDKAAIVEALGLDRTTERLIPDCRVLQGAPNTVLNLREAFRGTRVDTGDPLALSLLSNSKPKVARANIEGENLVLNWGMSGSTEITVRAHNEVTQAVIDVRFKADVWQPDYLSLTLTVIGGLGIFLLGMKNMSEGLQAIAGTGLRRLISKVTTNRFMAVGVGTLVTMLVQSSSITTVMVVGFVNSGFMTLSQAIGVIMGANIGTTITGWILALEIGKYGLPMLGVGAFGYLFPRRESFRFAALAIMGLGMVFFGLELMKNGFAVIKELPEFEAWFARFDTNNYWGVLKCATVGCVLTFLVQSSSATLGITIGLASIGVIPFETAAALVLGENIGTTITALLASLGATTNARRAAYFHVLFNLLGVAWITAVFPYYISSVEWLLDLPLIQRIAEFDGDPNGAASVTVKIAAVHTGFNLINTIVFFPFAGLMGRLLERIVPQKAHKEKPHLTTLDVRMLDTPVMGIEQSRVEVIRMADGCNKMMRWLADLSAQDGEPDRKLTQRLFHREEVLDTIQDEILAFLSDLLAGHLPHDVIGEGRRQLRMADEFESISDYIASILKFQIRLHDQGFALTDAMRQMQKRLHDVVASYMHMITEACEQRNAAIVTKANTMRGEIKHLVRTLRNEHLQLMTDEKVPPFVNVAFTSTLNSYVRVSDHALNVAEALAGAK
jgi:phosphate:Na+ symporter